MGHKYPIRMFNTKQSNFTVKSENQNELKKPLQTPVGRPTSDLIRDKLAEDS